MRDCVVTDNVVHGNGGAVYMYDSLLDAQRTLFAGNQSVTTDGAPTAKWY